MSIFSLHIVVQCQPVFLQRVNMAVLTAPYLGPNAGIEESVDFNVDL